MLGDPKAKEGITKLRGKTYPWRGAVLVPTFHPAAALRGGGETLAGMRADFVRAKLALRGRGGGVVTTPKELRARTSSADQTRAVASSIAQLTRPGDLLLLAGDLGAGKTTFVQGFARAFGVTEPVTSPTFTLLHAYEGDVRILHADVYRMDALQEVLDLGLHEALDDGYIALVEWGDAASAALPTERLEVVLGFGVGDDDRILDVRAVGASWADRTDVMAQALEQFA